MVSCNSGSFSISLDKFLKFFLMKCFVIFYYYVSYAVLSTPGIILNNNWALPEKNTDNKFPKNK
eukprot:snap_masked-scaffold_75-processed-gene-0.18-mRNA-1 protein AED:1.00 eAED:1.00 QI:0/0/0/0/1/1/2/0/63